MKRVLHAVGLVFGLAPSAWAQAPADIRELKLRDWEPRSMLVSQTTDVAKAAVPVVDIHNHLGGGAGTLTPDRVKRYLAEMDATGVRTVINLDGGWDQRLKETVAALDEAHPGRFVTFALLDFDGISDSGWSEREVKRLEESFRAGAKGLKFHKNLGLGVRDKDGRLVPVDDPRLDPIWALCGKAKKPVLIHTGDPGAFFTPLDRYNERWHELNEHPAWLFHGSRFPARADLHAQRNRVAARHPETTFIYAHIGNDGEDLAEVGRWLDAYPNVVVEFGARISELGRQPYAARRFLIRYQDRVLFGSDTTPDRKAYRIYFRFLESDDEYFDPAGGHHRQGMWMIYGVFLPRGVLEKVYHRNAERILGLEP
jgi:predicted TIM-barrel fold metal-dependent hydrolase